MQRFFRYHDHMYTQALTEKKRQSVVHAIPYWTVFKQCFPQCFNVFFTFFVTLTIFPSIYAGEIGSFCGLERKESFPRRFNIGI